LIFFGPLWQKVRVAADVPLMRTDLVGVAERVLALSTMIESIPDAGRDIVTADGRRLVLSPRSPDRNWMIAAMVPGLLHRAGI
ncbi:hypothetical protein NL526_29530, partial [Klebsiella pneumoniae]|nr:hypothetical protein [Klebsiella pneumoniae]